MKSTINLLILLLITFVSIGQQDTIEKLNWNYEKLIEKWVDYYKGEYGNTYSFNFYLTHQWTEKSLLTTTLYNYTDINKTGDYLKKLYVYSPDSSKYIDLDSYKLIIMIDTTGRVKSQGGEVDSEVAMCDNKNNKRTRILFCGTPCIFEYAAWINNSNIIIAGLGEDTKDIKKYRLTVITIDITDRIFKMYQTNELFEFRLENSYNRKVRLTNIDFSPDN